MCASPPPETVRDMKLCGLPCLPAIGALVSISGILISCSCSDHPSLGPIGDYCGCPFPGTDVATFCECWEGRSGLN
eukprot:5179771-Karenia_brevis.AAC.1